MKPGDEIVAILRTMRTRLLLRAFLSAWARATLAFFGLLLALTTVHWWSGHFAPNLAGLPYVLAWPFAAGALAGAVIALLRWPSLRWVAGVVDALGGTRDRLLTALDFSGQGRPGELQGLAVREAAAFARGQNFRKLLPVRPPEELRWLVVPLVALGILWWDGLQAEAAREARTAAAHAETAGTVKQLETLAEQMRKAGAEDETARKLAERLKESAAQLRAEAEQGRDGQKAALRELAQLEQLVQELRRPEAPTPDELKALASALSKDEKTRAAAQDLQQGNLAAAARELAEAARDEMTAEHAEQVIRQALNELAQRKEELSKQLEQMRQEAAPGGSERQQLLQQLSDLLNEMQQNGQLAQQPSPKQGNQSGKDGQGGKGGSKPMSDEDLKKLLSALQQMKDQQQGGQLQPGDADGKDDLPTVAIQNFSPKNQNNPPGQTDPNLPSGKPGSEKDEGTTLSPFGKEQAAADKGQPEQLPGKLGEGESLSVLVPSAAKGDAKAARRYKQLTEAAAADAESAVTQEDIPLGARFLIRRYFEAIREK